MNEPVLNCRPIRELAARVAESISDAERGANEVRSVLTEARLAPQTLAARWDANFAERDARHRRSLLGTLEMLDDVRRRAALLATRPEPIERLAARVAEHIRDLPNVRIHVKADRPFDAVAKDEG